MTASIERRHELVRAVDDMAEYQRLRFIQLFSGQVGAAALDHYDKAVEYLEFEAVRAETMGTDTSLLPSPARPDAPL